MGTDDQKSAVAESTCADRRLSDHFLANDSVTLGARCFKSSENLKFRIAFTFLIFRKKNRPVRVSGCQNRLVGPEKLLSFGREFDFYHIPSAPPRLAMLQVDSVQINIQSRSGKIRAGTDSEITAAVHHIIADDLPAFFLQSPADATATSTRKNHRRCRCQSSFANILPANPVKRRISDSRNDPSEIIRTCPAASFRIVNTDKIFVTGFQTFPFKNFIWHTHYHLTKKLDNQYPRVTNPPRFAAPIRMFDHHNSIARKRLQRFRNSLFLDSRFSFKTLF